MDEAPTPACDVLIVGGGSAGAVLAARLSAQSRLRVILLEAGPDIAPGAEPADVADLYPYQAAFNPAYQWEGLTVRFAPVPHNAGGPAEARRYEQARILGGGSSINGQLANRGTPHDYDGWEAAGATGWGWEGVLPSFRKLETDLDFSGPLHGADGPIRISRVLEPDWPGFSRAAAGAFREAGFRDIADQNAVFEDGFFPLATSTDRVRRVSTAAGYLTAEVRARPNLAIRTGTEVARLLLDGRHVVGVETKGGERIGAREVVVSAGAIRSPAFLLAAGIGPEAHLRPRGVPVVVDRRGVGANLQEHPSIALSAWLRPRARMGRTPRRHCHVGLRYTSALPDAPPHDMFMVAVARSAWHPLGRRIGTLFAWVNRPFSSGTVRLPADGSPHPDVSFDLLADRRDLVRLVEAFRLMARLFASPPLGAASADPFATRHGALAAKVREPTMRNRILTLVPALMTDGPAPLRRAVFDTLVARGFDLQRTLADEDLLEETVKSFTIAGWHASGTCRMGRSDDADAVVDPLTARVHGVGGLSVVDASIMPTVPRANTNIPTIMVAEKMADAILAR